MPDTSRDPVDHSRTARKYTGETMKNTRSLPGLVLAALGVLALVIGLYLLAVGAVTGAVVALVLAAITGAAATAWILGAHRRVVRAERRWEAAHPGVYPEPPTA